MEQKRRHTGMSVVAAIMVVAVAACSGKSHTPLPQAYLRIDMPQHTYAHCEAEGMPFSFEKNELATLNIKKVSGRDVWVDIDYPQWNAVVFLTHKRMAGIADLRGQTDTSQRLVESHYKFTSGVEEQQYSDTAAHIYGNTYRLHGKRVASTYQFWVTDSTRHFLRGALYMNQTPNNDSLAPILEYIQDDLDHLIETVRFDKK